SFPGAIPAQYSLVEYIETYRQPSEQARKAPIRNGLNLTDHTTPESRGRPEPPPTCPFINQQCQRTAPTIKPDNQKSPILSAGKMASVYLGDRLVQRR
ncbi:hypothetical protein Q4610_12515, partial [Sphingobium sp. HBC34]